MPALNAEVEQEALPLTNAPVIQTVDAPSLTGTVPVGDCPATVTVNVTLCANADGFGAEASVVVVAATEFTVCVRTFDVDVALLASPLYMAVIAWLPTTSAEVEHWALPPLKPTVGQIVVAPSLNVTVPVGD